MTFVTPEALIVADASPLIGLAKIGRLGILDQLARQVWIPREVWEEVVERGRDRPEARMRALQFGASVCEADPVLTARFCQQIDSGEAAALALASAHPGCLLLIDDAAGRELAEAHGIRCVGAAGLLLRAKQAGLIDSLASDLAALRAHGFFMNERLVRKLLTAAGEAGAES